MCRFFAVEIFWHPRIRQLDYYSASCLFHPFDIPAVSLRLLTPSAHGPRLVHPHPHVL